MNLEKLNQYRVKFGTWKTEDTDLFGLFQIPLKTERYCLKVIAAPFDNPPEGWEHVSCSLPTRCPTWSEMAMVKSLFWDEEQTVVQFHPKKSQYVNNMPYCLHLWRNTKQEHELPPQILTGDPSLGTLI